MESVSLAEKTTSSESTISGIFSGSFMDLSKLYLITIETRTPPTAEKEYGGSYSFICQVRRDTERARTGPQLAEMPAIPSYSDELMDRMANMDPGDPITVNGELVMSSSYRFQLADCMIE